MSTWMLGPCLGMIPLARDGRFPAMFGNLNKNGVPTGALILQAVIGSILAVGMIFIPSMNSAYWLLSALTTLCLCIEYLPMFAALIALRYQQPNTPRAYKLPWGTAGGVDHLRPRLHRHHVHVRYRPVPTGWHERRRWRIHDLHDRRDHHPVHVAADLPGAQASASRGRAADPVA